MKALIQRVTEASVTVDGSVIGEINRGILVLLGIEKNDNTTVANRMIDKLLAYRIFPDNNGKMNLSVSDISGAILLVSQFTLAADTRKGLRPGFSSAAPPEKAEPLYQYIAAIIKQRDINIELGQFAADMKVSLINDGPVTFMLDM